MSIYIPTNKKKTRLEHVLIIIIIFNTWSLSFLKDLLKFLRKMFITIIFGGFKTLNQTDLYSILYIPICIYI